MRLFVLTALTLTAFAANSILNRLGVATYGMDPGVFAAMRVAAGVLVLWGLIAVRGQGWPAGTWRWRLGGAAALALYMIGFSQAYLGLDAGVGALILFGGVQITMFAGAALGGEAPGARRLTGAGVAMAGLAVLVWPGGAVALPLSAVAMMLAAALGWGVYSLMGRSEAVPLAATGANFALCLPMVLPFAWMADAPGISVPGVAAALVSGGVMSGMGYALWYAVVPQLGAGRAGVAQLSVPLIAALGGVLALGETVDWRFGMAAVLVLGGIGLSLWPGRR